jgi:hypothetical protein
LLRARRAWRSTPLVLSLNLAMCWLTWYLADGFGAGAVISLSEQEGGVLTAEKARAVRLRVSSHLP